MIVVAGEALIDLVNESAVPGGSPANVAVTLARLGQPVRLLARLSEDPYGRQIRAHLRTNGVDLTAAVDAPEPTSLAIASPDANGQASYEFHMDGTADWQWTPAELPPLPQPAMALHSGSLALAMAPGASALEGLLSREHQRGAVTVSIDLNLRPSIAGDVVRERARIARQISLAHIVKASDEDLAWLYPGVPAASILTSWQRAGVACAVVTHGGEGAYLLAPNGVAYRRLARPVDVVDTVGAGDAFTGGMLTALAALDALGDRPADRLAAVGPQEWLSVLDFAGEVASFTCTRQGANPPTHADLESTHASV
jgi:sugar/nucleoside kinase (ribokinase family)